MMDAAMSEAVAFLEDPGIGFALTCLALVIAVVWLWSELDGDGL